MSKEENLIAKFEQAIEKSNALPSQSTDIQLKLYGLFKQAKFGDVTGDRPGRMKVRARAKFDEWTSRREISKEDAMKEYIKLVEKLEKSQ